MMDNLSRRGVLGAGLAGAMLSACGARTPDEVVIFGDQAAFDAKRIEAWATFGLYQALAEHRGARVLRDGVGINTGLGFITASLRALASPVKRRAIADTFFEAGLLLKPVNATALADTSLFPG